MEAIARNCAEGKIDARVNVVVSNVPDAGGLARAKSFGIPTVVVDHRDFADRREHETEIIRRIEGHPIDLVCLAGYMRVVTPVLLDRFYDRRRNLPGVINIHPADTRAYQGEHGYEFALGLLKRHPTRLAETRITVHFVDSGVDTGPIIRQAAVPVFPEDTLEDLRKRGLAQEYLLYSEAIQLIAEGRVRLVDRKVIIV
jgi:phosphoribosylglycinamide formyltransferase-1